MDNPLNQFACLGINWLGACSYDPVKPFAVYFGIGDAVAALALILGVQQVLRPSFRFRLQAYNLNIGACIVPVVIGFACVLYAAVLPNLPIQRNSFWSYPVNYELMAGAFMLVAYVILAVVTLTPARLHKFNLAPFVRAAINLLSSADEENQAQFAQDLLGGQNLETLIKLTMAFDRREWHSSQVEFGRLRQNGDPLVIHGRPPVSAFYLFSHRNELRQARHASVMLAVISDERFCGMLVRRCGILTAGALRRLSDKKIHNDSANSFIREIARQSIINDDSLYAREVGYHGFSRVSALSLCLFSDPFILRHYNPFDFSMSMGERPTASQLSRFNDAAKSGMKALISVGHIYENQIALNIHHIYETIFMDCWRIQRDKTENDALPMAVSVAIETALEMAVLVESKVTCMSYQALYVESPNEHRFDILEYLAKIVFDALCRFANNFVGFEDAFWLAGIQTFMKAFPTHGANPDGMTPFQQRLALKIVNKLHDNMQGFYPAISRVLLACIGPYHGRPGSDRTAAGILMDAVYYELQSLPKLVATAPDKITHYMPENVTFDDKTGCLIHSYRGGEKKVTDLTGLCIEPCSLAPEDVVTFVPTVANGARS